MKKTLQIQGHKIVYDEYGDARNPPIILLHGWLSYRGVWQRTAQALQDQFYCIAVDMLGFGESDKPKNADYTIKAQGNRVIEVANSLGFANFSLIGHSMGGQVALCVASSIAPDRVDRLGDVGGVVSGRLEPYIENVTIPFTGVGRFFPQLYSLWRWLFRYDFFVKEVFKTWFFDMESVSREMWSKDRDMAFQPEAYVSANKAGQAIQALNLESDLGKIIAPTIIIFGENDAVVPISDGYLAEKNIQGGRFEIIENCGHFPMYEKAQEFERVVLEFFSTGPWHKVAHKLSAIDIQNL